MTNYKTLLREKYYLEHFEYLIAFVKTHYYALLKPLEAKFIQLFENLSYDARCLLARLYNRQGIFFAPQQVYYAEIADIAACFAELVASGSIEYFKNNSNKDMLAFLQSRTLQELQQAVNYFSLSINKEAKQKIQLIELIMARQSDHSAITDYFIKENPIIILPFKSEYLVLKFLLFGNLKQSMAQFAIKELKGAAPLAFDENAHSPLFKSRQEIDECLAVQSAYLYFKAANKKRAPAALYSWFESWYQSNTLSTELARQAYDKFALKIADYFAKLKLFNEALFFYNTTHLPPANERRIRLYARLEQTTKAIQLCEKLLLNSTNAQELIFAQDFKNKYLQQRAKKATTLYLATAEKLNLLLELPIKPELAVINYLTELNYCAYFTENYLWKSLFGLFFWDLLFEKSSQYLHHPFQTIPSDLTQGKLLLTRKKEIAARLDILNSTDDCVTLIKKNYNLYHKTDNWLVYWHPDLLITLEKCCLFLTSTQLKVILTEMAKDWRNNSSGFPDLFCWQDEDYTFIEVKSINDKLSSQQLHWLLLFKEIGVKAKVIHAKITYLKSEIAI